MSQSRQSIEQKKQAVIQAARESFLGKGYSGTSMDTIAETAGVTKQTVYRYYPSKERLFAAVMQLLQSENSNAYRFSNKSLQQELTLFGNWLLEFHLTPEALGIYRLMLTEGARNKKLFRAFQSTGSRYFLEPLINFLKPRFSDESQLVFAANMFCTMILSARNKVLLGQSQRLSATEIQDHVRDVVELFVSMIPEGK